MSTSLTEPTKVVIPVNAAIAKTTNWRNFMQRNFPDADVKTLPKAVYISKSDIEDLAKYCAADDSIVGVRAYFTLENAFEEGESNEVKFIMVLVKDTEGYPNGEDLLYIPQGAGMQQLSPDDGALDDSNVYDFTKPCPEYCDATSQLFSNDPKLWAKKKKV